MYNLYISKSMELINIVNDVIENPKDLQKYSIKNYSYLKEYQYNFSELSKDDRLKFLELYLSFDINTVVRLFENGRLNEKEIEYILPYLQEYKCFNALKLIQAGNLFLRKENIKKLVDKCSFNPEYCIWLLCNFEGYMEENKIYSMLEKIVFSENYAKIAFTSDLKDKYKIAIYESLKSNNYDIKVLAISICKNKIKKLPDKIRKEIFKYILEKNSAASLFSYIKIHNSFTNEERKQIFDLYHKRYFDLYKRKFNDYFSFCGMFGEYLEEEYKELLVKKMCNKSYFYNKNYMLNRITFNESQMERINAYDMMVKFNKNMQ